MKTDIFHMGVERDEYFSSAFFGFAQGLLDHNFSQNLKLQQTYGGGIGWSVIKRTISEPRSQGWHDIHSSAIQGGRWATA